MAEPWEVEVGGQVYEIEADTPQQAAVLARLMAAREQGVGQAEAGAMERSQERTTGQNFLEGLSRQTTFGQAPTPQESKAIDESGVIPATVGLMTVPALAGAAISAPAATAAGLGASYLGSELAERGGRKLESYGAPEGTSKVLGFVGGLGGGIYGSIKGQAILKDLLKAGVGRGSMLGQILERAAGTEAVGAVTAAKQTPEALAAAEKRAAQDMARREAEILKIRAEADKANAARDAIRAKAAQLEERHRLQAEILRKRATGELPPRSSRAKAPAAKPETAKPAEPEMLPDDAVSVVPEPTPTTAATKAKGVDTAPYDATAIKDDPATIALQIQQKSGILTGATPNGRKIVAEELSKLSPGMRTQVEEALARGQAHPPTTGGAPTGLPKPAPYVTSSKPLESPLMEFVRREGSKPGRAWGEKIYVELDSAGKPVRLLNGPQAAAALDRRGVKTTWVKNLWGKVHKGKRGMEEELEEAVSE